MYWLSFKDLCILNICTLLSTLTPVHGHCCNHQFTGSAAFVCICRSAHLLSRYRPRAPIIAVTRNAQTARQAHLYRGIFPVLYTKPGHDVWAEDVDMRVNFAMDVGKA